MKRILTLLFAVALLSSCGSTTQVLYYWGGESDETTVYEKLAYKDYKNYSPKAVCNLVCAYEDIVGNPGGKRMVPPPGICAEYGYLLLKPETATFFEANATKAQKKVFGTADYGTLFETKGKEMLLKEIEYYPESSQFIRPLIEKLSK